MPSRGRQALEAGLRAIAFAAVGGLLWLTVHADRNGDGARAHGDGVREALARWSTREAPGRVRAEFDSAPSPEARDWLAALGRAGTSVTWGGTVPIPTGVAAEPVADPRRPIQAWVAAPAGTRVVLRDRLGVVDSGAVARGGARLVVPRVDGALRATAGDIEAVAAVHDSLILRPILLLGQAGWEAKFALAALEEHGWRVDARLAVAPSGDTRQGADRVAIDTGRYAAVVALDSVAGRYAAQLLGYIRDGGGLIAIGDGAGLRSLAPVLPGSVSGPPSLPGRFTRDSASQSASPRVALALAPIRSLKAGALPLETRARGGREEIAAAAWRVGRGRVVQIGYWDTWRWRMAGAENDPVGAHRAWWAALVSGVAFAPRVPLPTQDPLGQAPLGQDALEPTPLASLITALGPASPRSSLPSSLLDSPNLVPILFALMLGALLLEWTSRRLRGSR